MTTTINRFSVRRLWTVAKRDAALDWKTNLAHFLEFAGALLAGLVIIMLPAKTDGNSFNVIADTFYSWFSLVLTVGGLIAASSMLKPISDKTGSISLLTLPATNAEKFVERALMVTVGYTISALAALVVVGVLYYPLAFIFGIDSYGSLTAYCTQSFFAPTFDNINTQVSVESQIVVMAWQWRGQLLACCIKKLRASRSPELFLLWQIPATACICSTGLCTLFLPRRSIQSWLHS